MATTLNPKTSVLGPIIAQHRQEILAEWLQEMSGATRRADLMKESELQARLSRMTCFGDANDHTTP